MIAPSHFRIDIHRRSLVRQTQTDPKLISRVHGSRTHAFRTIQRNIEHDAQPGRFSSQSTLQADACKRTGQRCQSPSMRMPLQLGCHPIHSSSILHSVLALAKRTSHLLPHQSISPKLTHRIHQRQHSRPHTREARCGGENGDE